MTACGMQPAPSGSAAALGMHASAAAAQLGLPYVPVAPEQPVPDSSILGVGGQEEEPAAAAEEEGAKGAAGPSAQDVQAAAEARERGNACFKKRQYEQASTPDLAGRAEGRRREGAACGSGGRRPLRLCWPRARASRRHDGSLHPGPSTPVGWPPAAGGGPLPAGHRPGPLLQVWLVQPGGRAAAAAPLGRGGGRVRPGGWAGGCSGARGRAQPAWSGLARACSPPRMLAGCTRCLRGRRPRAAAHALPRRCLCCCLLQSAHASTCAHTRSRRPHAHTHSRRPRPRLPPGQAVELDPRFDKARWRRAQGYGGGRRWQQALFEVDVSGGGGACGRGEGPGRRSPCACARVFARPGRTAAAARASPAQPPPPSAPVALVHHPATLSPPRRLSHPPNRQLALDLLPDGAPERVSMLKSRQEWEEKLRLDEQGLLQ